MFNEIIEINGIRTYKVDDYISGNKDIIIFEIPEGLPSSMFNELVEYILENGNIPKFDEKRNIKNEIYSDYILIEYNDKKLRNNDKKIMTERFNPINALKSEVIDGNKQIAEPVGYFDLDGKYYLVLSPYNPFIEETNSNLGIYKGVIVNPELYFGQIGKQIKEVEDKIEDIIK